METKVKNSDTAADDWFLGFHRFIQSDQRWEVLRDIFDFEPELILNHDFRRQMHGKCINQIQSHLIQDLQTYFISAFKIYVNEVLGIQQTNTNTNIALTNMRFDGYTHLPAISLEEANILENFLSSCPLYDGDQQGELTPISKDDASNKNMVKHDTSEIINSAEVLYQATNPDFLDLAEKYLEVPPLIGNVSSWHSYGGREKAIHAQNFHLDLDDYRFCKGFIYLTDVDDNTGPHCYIPESHRFDFLEQRKLELGDEASGFSSWYGTLRKTDQDCLKYLGNEPVNLTGDRGSRLMVDTSGIHKGLLPVHGHRFILQFLYCTTPFASQVVDLTPYSGIIKGREDLEEHFNKENVRYALQLLVDFES